MAKMGYKYYPETGCIKKQRHHFANKDPYHQSYSFSSSHVQMWDLDHRAGWGPKIGCFQIVVLEKTLESPWDSKGIKPVNPKGNQLRIFIGRTDVEAETPILGPDDAKSWLTGKDQDAGKDWGQEKGVTEDEMVGWHHHPWTWVWVDSESWWRTGKPGILQSMELQRIGQDRVTE